MDNDREFTVVIRADALNHSMEHTLHTKDAVAVFFTGAGNAIYQKTFPGQLKSIEAFDFL